jgi:glycerol-3-phosphate dehydrogenase
MRPPEDPDVIIIGGGVIGCAIAFELARYEIKTTLIEKDPDVSFGASSANTGLIHAGFNPKPGTLKAKFNVEGNHLMPQLAKELNIKFKRLGTLVLYPEESKIQELLKRGERNGVKDLRILDKDELHALEPHVAETFSAALFAPSAGIISPYELTIALANCAAHNGVIFMLSTKVTGLLMKRGAVNGVRTNKGKLYAKIVINAAGLFADEIIEPKYNTKPFSIKPRRGEYLVLDKRLAGLVKHTLFPVPTKKSKGIVVTPTVEGNILLGPTATEVEAKSDTKTTALGQRDVLAGAQKLVPSIKKRDVIATFAGLRAINDTGDFVIGPTKLEGLINAAGISSPGLTAAPAIAKFIVKLIEDGGLIKKMVKRSNYQSGLPYRFTAAEATSTELDKQIKQNPAFGNVICRCELVTEGELQTAITGTPGLKVTTLKGLRYRTRITQGRCQGAFCTQKSIFILARELGIPPEQVTFKGPGSELLYKTAKGDKSKQSLKNIN